MHVPSDVEIVQLGGLDARTATDIATMHVAGLPDSINSLRGSGVVGWLYQQLARNGHRILVAKQGERIVGALALVDSELPISLMTLAWREPLQWLRLVSTKPLQLWRLIMDARAVERPRKRTNSHLYIASLVVAGSHQRLGIARNMVNKATAIGELEHRRVFVDTRQENVAARHLYEGAGFVQIAETRLSVVFRW